MLQLYVPLNIFIALVGVVVWTEYDEISLSSNGDTTLTNFLHYRRERLVKEHPNDNAQLLTYVRIALAYNIHCVICFQCCEPTITSWFQFKNPIGILWYKIKKIQYNVVWKIYMKRKFLPLFLYILLCIFLCTFRWKW